MTPTEFVDGLRQRCIDGAVNGCVASFDTPPGRKPAAELLRISQWFQALSPPDRELVISAMREAAHLSLFNALCVIDGAAAIEPIGEKSEFVLTATRAGSVSRIAPGESDLHDLL